MAGDGSRCLARFSLGRILATRQARERLSDEDIGLAILRHVSGDWGDVCSEDWEANTRALETGARLLSAYVSWDAIRFYLITEHDRSATTILLPEEY